MKVACVVYYAFLGVLRYLNKAFVFFCAKYFNKKNKTVLITSISILLKFSVKNIDDISSNTKNKISFHRFLKDE